MFSKWRRGEEVLSGKTGRIVGKIENEIRGWFEEDGRAKWKKNGEGQKRVEAKIGKQLGD